MTNLPPPERVYWHVEDRFYSEAADGTVGVWELTGTVGRIPVDHRVKLVRLCRLGERTPEQLKAQHAQEIQVARDMAGAHERAVVGERLRQAELRAELAEQKARAGLETKARKLVDAQLALDGDRRDWVDVLTRFIAMADRIGEIWGEGEIGTQESSAWRDPETGEHIRHFTSVALQRVLERLEGVLAEEHPSVTYPRPSAASVELATGVLRAQLGHGHDFTPAMTEVLAALAHRERTAGTPWEPREGAQVWCWSGDVERSGRWLTGTLNQPVPVPGHPRLHDVTAHVDPTSQRHPIAMHLRVGLPYDPDASDALPWSVRPRGPGQSQPVGAPGA